MEGIIAVTEPDIHVQPLLSVDLRAYARVTFPDRSLLLVLAAGLETAKLPGPVAVFQVLER